MGLFTRMSTVRTTAHAEVSKWAMHSCSMRRAALQHSTLIPLRWSMGLLVGRSWRAFPVKWALTSRRVAKVRTPLPIGLRRIERR